MKPRIFRNREGFWTFHGMTELRRGTYALALRLCTYYNRLECDPVALRRIDEYLARVIK